MKSFWYLWMTEGDERSDLRAEMASSARIGSTARTFPGLQPAATSSFLTRSSACSDAPDAVRRRIVFDLLRI